jgi:hypothetical protein
VAGRPGRFSVPFFLVRIIGKWYQKRKPRGRVQASASALTHNMEINMSKANDFTTPIRPTRAVLRLVPSTPRPAQEVDLISEVLPKMPPVPAEAVGDPAFALIAEKIASHVRHCRAIDLVAEFEQRRDFSSCAAIAADAEETAACRYVSEVEWRLARTQPSTLAGVAAVLRFVNEIEDANLTWPDSWEGWHYQLRATMAAAIEALIAANKVVL